jgi:glucose/arabinose dehydrogenase
LYSFGRAYDTDQALNHAAYPNPLDSGSHFISPLYYFSPSIGICGIQALQDNSFERWKNALLVTSLRNMSVHIIKLNNSLNKVISDEIIPFQQRLRSVTILDSKIFVFGENNAVFILSK